MRWEGRGKDVFRQIFLFFNGQVDPPEEYKIIQLILNNYFVANSTQRIDFNTISSELKSIGFEGSKDSLCKLAQKAIYRLSVLGIVSDWTTDFTNHYEVDFQSMEDQDVSEALLKYLIKYQPDIKLPEELAKINRPTWRDRCIWYLLQWTFDNIIYNRKQTLKTLADWCNDFEQSAMKLSNNGSTIISASQIRSSCFNPLQKTQLSFPIGLKYFTALIGILRRRKSKPSSLSSATFRPDKPNLNAYAIALAVFWKVTATAQV